MGWGLCTVAGVAGKGETLDIVPRFLITGRRVAGSSFGGVKGRDQVPRVRRARARRRDRRRLVRLAPDHARRRQPRLRADGGAGRHPERDRVRMIVERVEHPQWLSNAYLVAEGAGGNGFFIDGNGLTDELERRAETRRTSRSRTSSARTATATTSSASRSSPRGTACRCSRMPRRTSAPTRASPTATRSRAAGSSVRALYTPGHCDDHLAFLVDGTHCFTADVLFRGTVGGTAGPDGDLGKLKHSILDVLLALDPGDAGLPGSPRGHDDRRRAALEPVHPRVARRRGPRRGAVPRRAARTRRSCSGPTTTTAATRRSCDSRPARRRSSAAPASSAAENAWRRLSPIVIIPGLMVRRARLLGVLLAAGIVASGASAMEETIDPGVGIGKLKLGMTRAQVVGALGKSYTVNESSQAFTELGWNFSSWTVRLKDGRAVEVGTSLHNQKTTKRVGPGAFWQNVVKAYPGGACTFNGVDTSLDGVLGVSRRAQGRHADALHAPPVARARLLRCVAEDVLRRVGRRAHPLPGDAGVRGQLSVPVPRRLETTKLPQHP